jgi:predicted metal-dependent phosphoesterase TrpH
MKNHRFDLHCHSTASDGTLSPYALVRQAKAVGVDVLALTDHDTVAGIAEFTTAARRAKIYAIPGVEIGTQFEPGTLHLLGYYIDPHNRELIEQLEEFRQKRRQRAQKMLDQLQKQGIELTLSDVRSMADDSESLGRPHFARALVKKGYASDLPDAFSRFLVPGRPGYCPREKLLPKAAIRLIEAAGGRPVLAHPKFVYPQAPNRLESLLRELCAMGLAGLEVYYPEHSASDEARFVKLAEKFDLITTGGSDYHGPDSRKYRLGFARDSQPLPVSVLHSLSKWDKNIEHCYISHIGELASN